MWLSETAGSAQKRSTAILPCPREVIRGWKSLASADDASMWQSRVKILRLSGVLFADGARNLQALMEEDEPFLMLVERD